MPTRRRKAIHSGKPPPTLLMTAERKGRAPLPRYPLSALIGLALLSLGVLAFGCRGKIGGNGGSLPSGEWRGWKPEQKIMEYGRDDLSEYLSSAAGQYLGYGFRRLWVRPYHNSAGQTLTAELFDLSSGEEAYGVFSRDWTGEALEIAGAEAFYAQGALRMRKGKYYLWLLSSTQDDRYREDLLALAEEVARHLPPGLPIPQLVQELPRSGIKKDSIFYFHTRPSLDSKVYLGRQNFLQLSRKTKAALASYDLPEGRANLLLVKYPEGEAANAFTAFREGYFSKATAAEDSPGLFIAETKSGVYEGVAQAADLLAVVLNAENQGVCRRLLGAVRSLAE